MTTPKPLRDLTVPGLLHPGWHWIWRTRPKLVMCFQEHAAVGAASRFRPLMSRPDWRLQNSATMGRGRFGPHVSMPDASATEIEKFDRPLTYTQNESYTIAMLVRPGAGDADQHLWRSGSGSNLNHMYFLSGGDRRILVRHTAVGGGTLSLGPTDTIELGIGSWQTIAAVWRPGRLEHYRNGQLRASSTAANVATSAAFAIQRFGWGFAGSQNFIGDIAQIICCGSAWTPAMVARWHADPFGFVRPYHELPSLIGSTPPAGPPSTGSGVIVCLMT
jgi:hypothetical protein